MAPLDSRVPLRFAETAAVPDEQAVFQEGEHFAAAYPHRAGCACCAARNPAGVALAALLQDRARGRVVFFRGVTAITRTPAGRAMVLEALRSDPVASACYRLES